MSTLPLPGVVQAPLPATSLVPVLALLLGSVEELLWLQKTAFQLNQFSALAAAQVLLLTQWWCQENMIVRR